MRATVFLSLLFISFAIFTVSYLGYPSNYSVENQAVVAQLSNNGTQEPTNSSQQLATQKLIKTMGINRLSYRKPRSACRKTQYFWKFY